MKPVDTSGLWHTGSPAMTLDAAGRVHLACFVETPDYSTVFPRHARFTGALD